MASPNEYDDRSLWLEYAAAKEADDAAKMSQVRSQIVETHLGFFVSYAHDNAFKSWGDELVQGYLHELVLVAMSLVDRYDPDRGVKFISFCRPYLRPVAWKVQATRGMVWNGYETERLRALIRRRQSEAMGRGEELSVEELAEELAAVHGKRITVGRVLRIIQSPSVVSGDAVVGAGGEDGTSIFDKVSDDYEVSARLEQDERIKAVRRVLDNLNLSELEVAIVTRVLMTSPYREHTYTENGRQVRVVMEPGPASDKEIAEDFGIPVAVATATRERLVATLRRLLG